MANKPAFKALPWDSEFFGKRIGQLQLDDSGDPSLSETDFDHLQIKVAATDYQLMTTLQQQGYQLAEGEVDFVMALAPQADEAPRTSTLERATADDIPALRALAAGTFDASRFRAPWFAAEQRDSFYQLWLEKAVLGTFDDVCLVSRGEHGIEGFVTLKFTDNDARIGLIAVSDQVRGRGVGRRLLQAAGQYSLDHQASSLYVATQMANRAANALYSKSGFSIHSLSYWFYKAHDSI